MNKMSVIQSIFKHNRPDLSAGTLRTYSSIVRNLAKQMEVNLHQPKDVISHAEAILDHLKNVEPKSRKTRLACLIVFIDKDTSKEGEDAIKAFRELMTDDAKVSAAQIDEQKLTDRQKEGMMTWAEVMHLYNALGKEVQPLFKRATLDKYQFQKCQMYVLLSCLTLIPPRRSLDYAEFKIREADPEADNFMKIEKKKGFFVFNVYKTARKYKTQQEEIPTKLVTIIKNWTKVNPHNYLLMNSKQTGKINSTQITNMLHDFFKKPTSTSLLRHIYLSDKYKNVPALKDMKETAAAMGHSVDEGLNYVKK